jgi:hypothetical protein
MVTTGVLFNMVLASALFRKEFIGIEGDKNQT